MTLGDTPPGPIYNGSMAPRFAVVRCPRCLDTLGLEPPPNDESQRDCRLCTGSMVLLVDGHDGEVRAVTLPE